MAVRIGILSSAHLHVWGYAAAIKHHPDAELVGIWDDDAVRAAAFAERSGSRRFDQAENLLGEVDAVIITSENKSHSRLAALAAAHGRHVLCEKPLVTSEAEGKEMLDAVKQSGIKLMTAFPCRYSPAFTRLVERVGAGDIGSVRAACTTNRGRCPFGWFVEPEKSGGGAMIDHVVHVADLLRVLLKSEVVRVQAQVGNNMYGQDWEDIAMLTLEFQNGVFATLDSSWSRPKSYKTWGDVTMSVVGERGVIELDMFGQALDVYSNGSPTHSLAAYGTNLDAGLVGDFVACIQEDREPPISGFDGLQAARVAIAGYESAKRGQPVEIAS
jgi:predicted dehydrogenase